jgi:hypothetical protein
MAFAPRLGYGTNASNPSKQTRRRMAAWISLDFASFRETATGFPEKTL